MGRKFSIQSVCHLGIELVNALEEIHSAGYVYNDLKPDNITLGGAECLLTSTPDNVFKNAKIMLIDFGLASTFINQEGKHKRKKKLSYFAGNMMFASLNQMKFNRTSRRDDMIALAYLILYLLNNCEVPGLEKMGSFAGAEAFKNTFKIK